MKLPNGIQLLIVRVLSLLVVLSSCCCLAWAQSADEPAGKFQHSLIYMHYDVGRDISVVRTIPFFTTDSTFTPQQYADALAARPEMGFAASGQNTHYRDPEATVDGDTLMVNYRDSATEASMSSSESMQFSMRFSSWFWVPGISRVRFYANGKAVTRVGEGSALKQPLMRDADLFLANLNTHEVRIDWSDSKILSEHPTLDEALRVLRERRQHQLDRPDGCEPVLPPGMTLTTPEYPKTTLAMNAGVLHIDLPANFPRHDQVRLAGMVLLLTQFPQVLAVRFTFGGAVEHEPFMHVALDEAITPYDLDLPEMQIQSLLHFSYDIHAGDAVTMVTQERAANLTPLEYAQALARLPAMQWVPLFSTYRLLNPQVEILNDELIVRYAVEGQYTISNAEMPALQAMLEAWWWVPGIRKVTFQDGQSNPLPTPEYVKRETPMTRRYHTYAYLPGRDTTGYLTGPGPASLSQALRQLEEKNLGDYKPSPNLELLLPAGSHFRPVPITVLKAAMILQPLLPSDSRFRADPRSITDGILNVDLSSTVLDDDKVRLEGIVMMLTQFPEVAAVRFTFDGKIMTDSFYRTTLDKPISPYEMDFPFHPAPPISALLINGQTFVHVRQLVDPFGGKSLYYPKTNQVSISLGKVSIILQVGKSIARINNRPLQLGASPRISDGKLFVPLRPLAAALGLKISWTGITRNIIIRQPSSEKVVVLPVSNIIE